MERVGGERDGGAEGVEWTGWGVRGWILLNRGVLLTLPYGSSLFKQIAGGSILQGGSKESENESFCV